MIDWMKAAAIKKYVNQQFKQYGELIDLDLDTEHHKIQAKFTIREGSGTWTGDARYKLKKSRDGNWTVTITAAKSNNNTVHKMLQAHVVKNDFEVPSALAILL